MNRTHRIGGLLMLLLLAISCATVAPAGAAAGGAALGSLAGPVGAAIGAASGAITADILMPNETPPDDIWSLGEAFLDKAFWLVLIALIGCWLIPGPQQLWAKVQSWLPKT